MSGIRDAQRALIEGTDNVTRHCPQCGVVRRVTEPYAFWGADRFRSTLSCGHVVRRVDNPPIDRV